MYVEQLRHPQHVIVRGNNRDPIFITDEDYRFYLEKLHGAAKAHGCEIHAYVLMTNHVHLLVNLLAETSIVKLIQQLATRRGYWVTRNSSRVLPANLIAD